jgi:LysM repeat protein
VRKGDTVLSVADHFGVQAENVREWNHLSGNALHAGRSLTVFKPAAAVAAKPSTTSNSRAHGHANAMPGKPKAAPVKPKALPAKKSVAATGTKTLPAKTGKHKHQG